MHLHSRRGERRFFFLPFPFSLSPSVFLSLKTRRFINYTGNRITVVGRSCSRAHARSVIGVYLRAIIPVANRAHARVASTFAVLQVNCG